MLQTRNLTELDSAATEQAAPHQNFHSPAPSPIEHGRSSEHDRVLSARLSAQPAGAGGRLGASNSFTRIGCFAPPCVTRLHAGRI